MAPRPGTLGKHETNHSFSDLFSIRSKRWLKGLKPPDDDDLILELTLAKTEKLDALVEDTSKAIAKKAAKDPRVKLLLDFASIPFMSKHTKPYRGKNSQAEKEKAY